MEGTVIRVFADKKFGFIRGDDNQEYFFHQTDLNGFFDDLVEDMQAGNKKIKVQFDSVESSRGLRAGNVVRVDGGV